MSKRYETIIFDLDGTLLDTSHGIFNSVRFAESELGLEPVSDEALKGFVGPPPKEMYRKVYGLSEELATEAAKKHREYGKTQAIYEAEEYPNMSNTLKILKDKGFKLAVATLKSQPIAEAVLSIHKMADFFDVIIGMDAKESLTKCQTIELAIEKTNTTGLALMVGDSEYDAIGAQQAKVDFVGASYGFGISASETRFPLIHSPEELLTFVE